MIPNKTRSLKEIRQAFKQSSTAHSDQDEFLQQLLELEQEEGKPPSPQTEYGIAEMEDGNFDVSFEAAEPSHSSNRSTDDQKLRGFLINLMTTFLMENQLSKIASQKIESLMTLIYGEAPRVSFSECWEIIDNNTSIEECEYYCYKCLVQLKNKKDNCQNPRCLIYKVKSKKRNEPVEMVRIQFEEEIKNLVSCNLPEIMIHHQRLHAGDIPHDGSTRAANRYQKIMETEEQFDNGIIYIPYILSHDGFVSKRNCKNEITPVYFNLCGTAKEHDLTKTSTILSLMKTSSYVNTNTMDLLMSRIIPRLSKLEVNPMKVVIEDKEITVFLRCLTLITDLKAQHLCGQLPNWNCKHGCNICTTSGTKFRSTYHYHEMTLAPLRTTLGVLNSSKNASDGFTTTDIPKIFMVITCDNFALDYLHLCSEGIFKRILSEICDTPTSEWFKKERGRFDAIEDSVLRSVSYTYGRAVVPLSSWRKSCGVEIEQTSVVALGITAQTKLLVRPSTSFFLAALISIPLTRRYPNQIASVKALLDLARRLLIICAENMTTMKFHQVFCHLMDSFLEFGSFLDSSDYEKLHCQLQSLSNKKSTNNSFDYPKRFFAHKHAKMAIQRYMETNVLSPLLLHELRKLKINIEEESQKGLFGEIQSVDVEKDHFNFLASKGYFLNECQFWRRAQVSSSSGRQFILSAEKYWTRSWKTSQSFAIYGNRGDWKFCRVLLFFNHCQTDMVLIEKFQSFPFIESLLKKSQALSSESSEVRNICNLMMLEFARIDIPFCIVSDPSFDVIFLSELQSPAIFIPHERSFFMCESL